MLQYVPKYVKLRYSIVIIVLLTYVNILITIQRETMYHYTYIIILKCEIDILVLVDNKTNIQNTKK